jgi:L-lactate dehydrogenase complex protein LldG
MDRLISSLRRNGVEVVVSKNPEKDAETFFNRLDCLVSRALSVAEDTGILFFGGFEERRKAGLVEHHIAIVKRDDIKRDTISAYFHALRKSNVVFAVSSPSKTADIEGKLIVGMHGPKKFTVILEEYEACVRWDTE